MAYPQGGQHTHTHTLSDECSGVQRGRGYARLPIGPSRCSVGGRYFAVETWNLEKNNFTYGADSNNLTLVGHYTQLVWAASHRVGCGFHKCPEGGSRNKPYYAYVCNYCPM